MTPASDDLERPILEGHAEVDLALLAGLYAEASETAEAQGDRSRAAFFLTQAWIIALEAGLPLASQFSQQLKDWGCNS